MTAYLKSIELFAGAGGMALGLEQAGIITQMCVELDKNCCSTLRTNRPEWDVRNCDVAAVDYADYRGKIDVVSGGFPCQAFSYAGRKLGLEDIRGTLFHAFASCVSVVAPTLFVAENVRGLLTHDNGRTLKTIIRTFECLGYKVQYRLLNAVNYGVPQKRERVIIIGTKKDVIFEYPKTRAQKTNLKEALHEVPVSEGYLYSSRKKEVLDLVPPGGHWRSLPLNVQREYLGNSYMSAGGRTGMARRMSWDEPSLTLTCSPSQKQTDRCHPEETRPFTVREYARIQTFPDSWQFCGGLGSQYRQIGNAVPVLLAQQLGHSIVQAIWDKRLK